MMSESRTEEFLEKLKEIKVLDEKTVQSVYALLPLRYEEVGSDSGQPFLVDGDSLLLDLFSDPLIDWAHGVQVGHLFYTLEKRLHHLREADRTFQIVFFECLEGIWTNPAHQMIREVMIRHLEATPAITTVRFPNWWDNQKDGKTQSFRSWTKEFGPSFVVIASGKVGPSFQGNVRMAPYLFQALTIYLLAEDIRCVRSSELAFQSHTMLSFNLRMDTNVQKAVIGKPIETSGIPKSYVPTLKFDSTLFAQLQKNVALYDPSVVAEMPKATTAPAAPAETPKESPATKGGKGKDKGAKDKGGKGKKKGGKPEPEEKEEPVAAAAATPVATIPAAPCPRLLVTAYAVTQALKEDASEANVESAKVLILTAGSLPALTIRQRAQLITKQDDIISKALNAFIAKIVVHLTAAVRFSSLPYHPNVADLIDGRMAFKLRSILTRGPDASLPLPQSIESLISTAWDLVREAIGAPKAAKGKTASTGLGAFRPILLPGSIQKTPVATPESSVELHLVHRLDSQLVKDLVPGLEEKLVKQGLMEDKVMEDKSASRNLEKLGLKALEDLPEGVGFEDGLEPEPDDEPKLTKTDLKFMARNQRRKALLNQSARRHEREKQKYLAYMQKYAKSLKGGKIVLRDVIIVPAAKDDGKGKGKGKKKKPVAAPSAPETKGKATPKTKDKAAAPAKESMADKIRGEVTKRQRAEALEKVMRFIKVADARKTLEAKIAHLDENINSLSDPMSAIPGHMKLLEWCVTAWQKSKASGNIEPAVRIWQIVNDVFRRFKGDLEPKQLVELERALMELGFDNAAKMMADEYCSLDIDWKEFKSRPDDVYLSKDKISRAFQVGTSCPRFQLHYAGHVMMRNVDSAPDERVEGFYPDKWQRDLLDVVDNKWSALVVAPTSSGKTFVSYYAMKQVLIENKIIKRSTEKGIIVYVSPTKALVNQIAGDVYQRYGPVYGVYTLDWKFRVLECDVLITVPECLEEMLLSPNKEREQWAKQIKYVILDEIHTIGNVDGNVVQRLLLLIRAPFLALSATVGNPDPFYEWLKATQKLRKREIKMIVHKERWSDLETHLYLPVLKATNPAEKAVPLQIPEPKDTFGCVPMHPCAALGDGFGLDPTEGFPPDLQFAPKDSLAMYDAMSKRLELLPPDFKTRLEALSPDVHFREVLCIDKRQAREYENILKNELFDWVKHGLQSHVDAVLRSFYDSDLKARIQQLEDREGDNTYNKEWALQHLLPMLKELHHTNRLPALMFCFDRQTCEQMVQHLTEALEEMEVAKRKEEGADEKDAQKSKAKDKLLKALKKAAEKADKKPTKKGEDRDKDKDNNERQAQELQNMEPEAEVEYPVDPRYTFVGEGEYMDGEELNWWKKRMLLKTKWDKAHPLVRALDRGIGVHHNGLNKSYKDLVETLFRVKQLKVVVSTETLALGVNMPAKTSIFALDSRFLTPLQFRQMSGRAGRRGFDNIGHVLFFAVPPRKVFRLMKSPLTSLQGHFPLSATAVLRMLTYYDRAAKSRKADVLEGLRGMLQKPFCFTTEGMRAPVDRVVREERFIGPEIEHYFRFCVEYLVRKGLINSRGQPIGLAGLVANMHSMEPSNLAFVKLLESGAISKICEKFYEKKEEVAGVLMGVMCHFFNTIPIAPDNADSLRNNADKASFVVLEPLPTDVRSVLDEHNKETVELFTQLAQVFSILELPQASNQTGELEDVSLPVSRYLLGAIPSDSKEETKTKTIAAKSSTSKAKYTPATISKASRSDDEEEVDTPRRGGKIPPVTRFHDYDLAYKDNHDEDVHTGSWEDEGGDGGENDEAEEKKGQEEVIESWEDEGGDGEEEAPKAKEEKKKKPEPAAAAKKEAKVEVKAAAGQKQNGPATKGATPEALTGILKTVAQDSLKYSAISPFVGLSGHTDKFKSARDLAESVRAGVWLEPAVVPVSQTKDLHGNDLSLNAYALDFYRHGRFALLLKDNGLKSGDAWALLKKWSLFLGDITKSLKLYATDKDNNVLRTFEYLTTKFDGYFENIGHVSSE